MSKQSSRNTYRKRGTATLVAVLAGGSILALPLATNASWLPWSIVFAASPGAENPFIPAPASVLLDLVAARNFDPNPHKGSVGIVMTEGSALIANSGPEGTLVDIEHGADGGEISTYTVETGDTLSSIAAKNGISTNTILWANNLTAKSTLKPGMTLVILPVTGIEHTVQKGETVASLSKKYSGAIEDILSYNGLGAGESLIVGAKIIIPDGEPAVSIVKKVTTVTKKTVNLPSVPGFSNPLPAGRCTQTRHGNNGVDMAAPNGTPIYAAAAGSVIIAFNGNGWNGGYGNYVVINHTNGTQTLYAHMIRTVATAGTSVGAGELIGYVGSTGKSTGNHLHFEVRKAANPFCR